MRLVAACLFTLLVLPGSSRAVGEPQLFGTVSDSSHASTITLKDGMGNPVTTLAPGTYDITVTDNSEFHNFHLKGPGLPSDQATTLAFTGTVVWEDIALQPASTYEYVCDPHESFGMKGSFTTSGVSPPSPPPPGPPPPPAPPPPPPPPPTPPPPPPPAPPAHPHALQVSALRITVRGRTVTARARLNHQAVARLSLSRGQRLRRTARRQWLPGLNAIRLRLPRSVPAGRWRAELRVGSLRFRRTIRIG